MARAAWGAGVSGDDPSSDPGQVQDGKRGYEMSTEGENKIGLGNLSIEDASAIVRSSNVTGSGAEARAPGQGAAPAEHNKTQTSAEQANRDATQQDEAAAPALDPFDLDGNGVADADEESDDE